MTFSLRSTSLRHAARRTAIVLATAGLAASAGAAAPQVVFTYNTGVDAAQLVLADGQADPHFVLVDLSSSVTSPVYARTVGYPISPLGGWAPADAVSAWIAPAGVSDTPEPPPIDSLLRLAAPTATATSVGTDYLYRTTFDLTGYDLSQPVLLSGHWAADNTGLSIRLNPGSNPGTLGDLAAAGFGSYTAVVSTGFTAASFASQWFQTTNNAGFVPGINTLEFLVHNQSGPSGLRVDYMLEAAPVPEPAAWALLAAGGLVVLGLQRRRAPVQPAADGLNTAASA